MTDDTRFTIGQLARRTGLSVRTIRFYSDGGVVPEVDRTDAGYRLYDVEALARLELVKTLRDLDVDLPTIRRVLARETDLGEVIATHAAALDAQIRTLRLRRAVLRAVARDSTEAKEIDIMHKLAALSDEERRRIIRDFVDEVFAGIEGNAVRERMLAVEPSLPDDPSAEQVEAWIELAELVRDPAFRESARGMATRAAADPRTESDGFGANPAAGQAVVRLAGAARESGIAPDAPEARPVVEEILAEVGHDPGDRAVLADRIAAFTDARVERYWQLLGTINGWPPVPPVVPAWTWFAAALRATA